MEYTIEFSGDSYQHAQFCQMVKEHGGEIIEAQEQWETFVVRNVENLTASTPLDTKSLNGRTNLKTHTRKWLAEKVARPVTGEKTQEKYPQADSSQKKNYKQST